MATNTDISEAIGGRIAEYRVGDSSGVLSQITLKQLAAALSDIGADTAIGTLSTIERGISKPSLSQLLAIAAALGKLRETPVRLRDLLPESGTIAITPSWSCEARQLRGFLSGEPVTSDVDIASKDEDMELSPSTIRAARSVNYLLNEYRANPAPRHFDVTPEDLDRRIHEEYDRSLDDEAIARAEKIKKPGSEVTWQAKGRQTTIIIEELARDIDPTWQKKPYERRRK